MDGRGLTLVPNLGRKRSLAVFLSLVGKRFSFGVEKSGARWLEQGGK